MCLPRGGLPSRVHQVGNSTCHFCRSFANRLCKGVPPLTRTHRISLPYPTRPPLEGTLRGEAVRTRRVGRSHSGCGSSSSSGGGGSPQPRRPRRRAAAHARAAAVLASCARGPEAAMVPLHWLSMLRAASQVFQPREFSRKSHCPLLPKSEVRATSGGNDSLISDHPCGAFTISVRASAPPAAQGSRPCSFPRRNAMQRDAPSTARPQHKARCARMRIVLRTPPKCQKSRLRRGN